jgi:CRISPR-associated protein Csd1
MLLTKLYEHAVRLKDELPIEMYGKVKIYWLVELNSDGTRKGTAKGEGFTSTNGDFYDVPDIVRAAGIKPKLLADNGEYVFGVGRADSPPEKVAERHRQFKELVKKCAEVTQEVSVQAVVQFLESWNPERDKDLLPDGFDPTQSVTFRVGITIPAHVKAGLQTVQQFWASYTAGGEENVGTRPQMECLVTGKFGAVEERLPIKIKGIPDGQTAGTSLVSANAAPFTSYGLQNSLTSPISREAGEGFAKALNYLISTKESHLYMGSVVYVFWTKEKAEYDFWDFLKEDQSGEVRNLLNSMRSGERVHELADNQFYALGLSASGGRAVVRDWIESTILEAIQNLDSWFEAQEMVDSYGQFPEKPYLSVYHLSDCLYRDPRKEAIARVPPLLIQTALKGTALPDSLLARVIRRICVDRTEKNYPVTHARAVLIKLILTSQKKVSMTNMQSLNLNPDLEPQENSTYHCGRLLAQLEIIQREAQGKDINAALIDRYYSAASATPGKILGSLVEKSQAHLTKIRKDRRNVYEALQRQLEEIMAYLSPEVQYFPRTLTMQQQSIFALGYYHQRAENRRAAIAASKANKEKAAAAQSDA